jgi:ParB family transcriptional regulator, chromosome partitioning protein
MSYFGILEDINISKIHNPTNQIREDIGNNLNELAESIKQHGLLQPIVVRPVDCEYEVVAGNRRLAAASLLKLRKICCHVLELSDKEAYEVGLVENVQHKTMNAIEEAVAFNKYVEGYGWGGVCELAKRIGRSQEFVTKRIQLLLLPCKVREEIIRQRITPSTALELLPLDKESIEQVGDFIIRNSLSKNEARFVVKDSKKGKDLAIEHMQLMSNADSIRFDSESMTTHEKELYLLDKTLMRSIVVLKSMLANFNDIVNSVNDDWIVRELLMQYRLIIHGDIDTFLKLRKRLKMKMPRNYLGVDSNTKGLVDEFDDAAKSTPIHIGASFLSR